MKKKLIRHPCDLWEAMSGISRPSNMAKDFIKKAIYKGTDCGAWITFEEDRIIVGSIVEGVDECTDTFDLIYPFEYKKLWEALDEVEKQADEIWKRTHGCEDCGPEDEFGNIAINPNCKTCHGEGTII